jgi:hypothetical protein
MDPAAKYSPHLEPESGSCRKPGSVQGFWSLRSSSGVARFFLGQNTKMGKIVPNDHKMTTWPYDIPNGRTIFQMAKKYNNDFHSKALQNIPKLGFLV